MKKAKAYKQLSGDFFRSPRFSEENGFYSSPKSSYLMSRIKGKNTKVEVKLKKALWNLGLRYRINLKLKGSPDIVFPKKKIAVFVDGDFWHGYNWENRKQNLRTNREYWIAKIESNIRRDLEVNKILTAHGWKIIRFWDHEINEDLNACVLKIQDHLAQ